MNEQAARATTDLQHRVDQVLAYTTALSGGLLAGAAVMATSTLATSENGLGFLAGAVAFSILALLAVALTYTVYHGGALYAFDLTRGRPRVKVHPLESSAARAWVAREGATLAISLALCGLLAFGISLLTVLSALAQ